VQRYATPAPKHLASRAYAAGVVRRDAAGAWGMSESFARNQVRASRWTLWGDHIVLMQNANPSRIQVMLMALLDAGAAATLGSHTALELAGFVGWAEEAAQIHLIVPRGARSADFPGVRVHESRRIEVGDQVWCQGMPCTSVARSAIDAGAWQPYPRFACTMLAAVVQQRLCTGQVLDTELGRVGRVRHKAYLRLALKDIVSGAQAASELDVGAMCRRAGLVQPRRQVRRRDSSGRWRYLDAEWTLTTGEIGVLEVDGRHHLSVEHWQDDMRRERGVVLSGRRVLRATCLELSLEARLIAADLLALGVPCLSSKLPGFVVYRATTHADNSGRGGGGLT
jgi:hypothetical protein